MKHLKKFNESYQERIKYFDELKQMALDINHGKLGYEVDTVWGKTPHITKEQRDKYSKVPEWWWMKFKGIGPQINPSGEIAPRGKCQAKKPYKDKECYEYTSHLSMNSTGHAADGENLCPPMCFYCFNNWTEDHSDW